MCYVMTACIAIIIPSHLGREFELDGDSQTTLLTPDDSDPLTSSPAELNVSVNRSENASDLYCVYSG